MLAPFLGALLIGLAIGIVIAIFYFLNLQNTLKQCAPQNQQMAPGMVWLGLIPFFNYYWNFRIASAMADSLAAEYRMRGLNPSEERPGYQLGMAYAILTCCGVLQWIGIPILPQLAGLAGFVCWIVYWVRMSKYKNELMQHQFQFGMGNPNMNQFPNQFPGQPQPYQGQANPYMNQQQNPNQQNPYMNQQGPPTSPPPPQNPWSPPNNPNPPQ